MKKRLILSFFVLTFIIVASFVAAASLLSFKVFEKQLNKDLGSIVTLIRLDKNNGFSNEAISYKYSIIGNISFIDKDGNLISSLDSAIDEKENLLGREEVEEALRSGEGSSIRLNESLNQFYFYKAYVVFGEILLIAVPFFSFSTALYDFGSYLLIFLILTSALSAILSYVFYKKNLEPVIILEKFIRNRYKNKNITQVDIQTLPNELKTIADIFKETTKNLETIAAKEAEKKLYLYSTINSMEVGFIAVDEHNKIQLINSSAMRIFELAENESIYDNILRVTQNIDLNTAVLNTKDKLNIQEIIIGNKNFEVCINPLPENIGKLILLNDITNLRKLEKMRVEFVSNVTHELKTPLTSIRGYVDALKDGALEDKEVAAKFLGIIDVESHRLERLITDILSLSNIEDLKVARVIEHIDVKEVVDEVVSNFDSMSAKYSVVIRNDIVDHMIFEGNLELFKSMLNNLISNGIKYNKKDGQVYVEAKQDSDNIIIEVTDTGIGISKEDQERIFERFYKVDKSRSLDTESTGLGLSIVKHIVELFKGRMEVKSEPGAGTTFKVILPKKGV